VYGFVLDIVETLFEVFVSNLMIVFCLYIWFCFRLSYFADVLWGETDLKKGEISYNNHFLFKRKFTLFSN
jgi:hypothetical protein